MSGSEFRWTDRGQLLTVSEKIVGKVSREIRDGAIAKAPVDTGNLARSITILRKTRDGLSAKWVIGTNVHYAVFVEFGTRRMRAQPFLMPAFNAARRRYGS